MSLLGSIGAAFGLNKKTIGTLSDIGKGFLTGGPAGAITAGAANIAGNLKPTAATPFPMVPSINVASSFAAGGPQLPALPPGGNQYGIINIGGVKPGVPSLGPGNQTQSGWGGVQSGSSSTAPSPCATGYHWNKSGYYTKSGGWVPPRSKWVKNRRRNPLNPRALSRALGRLTSAKRAVVQLDRVDIKPRRRR